ncbi:MAG TPA: beta-ketoacyl synthase N-terminal-like domain-containing protein [Candidatus Omnitrophota bacterium]|nr:beta-ketoacyl synthase N-terminal-like domain-containing protein [Candidatus Omnitrophota bacterium]HPN88904.1 beta-ketoacyl synthase N-terminal-like domain-containing protein [Candidatus Omnitrophota bacterium]
MRKKRVVITGVGPISSIGMGQEAFWNGLLNNQDHIREHKEYIGKELWETFRYHKIENFDIHQFGIDRDKLKRIKDWKEGEENEDLNYLLASVKLALDDGKIKNTNDYRIGLVLAHENIGLMPFGLKISGLAYDMLIGKSAQVLGKKDFYAVFYEQFIKSGYDVQGFPNLFHVTQTFDIKNFSLFVNNACASGLYAMETASQIIKNDQSDIVITAVSDHSDIYKYVWFKEIGIYSEKGYMSPFSKNADGILIGDGAAGVMLEDYEHAQKRGAFIYAEYLGGGFDLENWKITVPQIGSQSYQSAIKKALQQSSVAVKDIDVLCAHGVGKKTIDGYESKAITDVFGKNPKDLAITAFKGYLGHTLGASALLETIIILLMMKNNKIIASKNCEDVDPQHHLRLVEKTKECQIKTVMKICCPFAGFNAAVLLKKG